MTVAEREWTAVADELKAARQQLSSCEREIGYADGYDSEEFEAEKSFLTFRIRQAHLCLSILLERLKLPLLHQQYMAYFARFENKLHEVGHVRNEPWNLYSLPLQFVDQTYEAAFQMLKGGGNRTYTGLQLFKDILIQAPNLIHDRAIEPTSEKDVRRVIFDTMKVVFPDTRREIPVAHIFKNFKGDIGVASLKALAEVKFADNEQELKTELEGIYADMRGYSGDSQWDNFFALIYTTKPIASQSRIVEEFKLAKADANWTPIVVNGPGRRSPKGRSKKQCTAAEPQAEPCIPSTES